MYTEELINIIMYRLAEGGRGDISTYLPHAYTLCPKPFTNYIS